MVTPEEETLLDEAYRAGLYDNPPKPPIRVYVPVSEKENAVFDPLGDMIHAVLAGGDVIDARKRLLEAIEQVDYFSFLPPDVYMELVGLLEEIAVETGRV